MSSTINLATLLQPVSDADKLDLFFRLLAGSIRGQTASSVTLDQLAALATNGFSDIKMELKAMSDANARFADEVTKLQADVAAQSTVIASATTAFQGLAAQIAAAEAAAKAAGATDTQIASITAVRQAFETNTAALAAAIPANTPAAATSGTTTTDNTQSQPGTATGSTTDPNAPQGTAVPV